MTERKVPGDAPVKPEHDNNKKSRSMTTTKKSRGMTAAKKTLAGTVMKKYLS